MSELKQLSFYLDKPSSVGNKFFHPVRGKRGWLMFWLMVSFVLSQTSLPINKLLLCALLFTPYAGFNVAKLLHQIRFQLLDNTMLNVESNVSSPEQTFSSFVWVHTFWLNRAMRVMPLYLLTLVLSLPPLFAGYGAVNLHASSFVQTLVTSILPISAWTLAYAGMPLSLSLWFMQILMFLWLLAPILYLALTRLTDHALFRVIQATYWMQLIISPVLFVLIQSHMNVFEAFAVSTFTPYTQQLFIFIAGFSAGLIQIRVSEDGNTAGSWHTDLVHYFPWRALLGYKQMPMTKNAFAEATNRLTFVTFIMLITGSIIGTVLTHNSVMGHPVVIWAAVLMPNLLQYATLCDSMALLRSDSLSFNSNAMSHLSFQFFGRISFPLFMLFPVVTMYAQWFTHGSSLTWPHDDNCIAKYRILSPFPLESSQCSQEWKLFAENCVPVVMTISILLAFMLIVPLEALNKQFKIKVVEDVEKVIENEMTMLERVVEETIAEDEIVAESYRPVLSICDDEHVEEDIESRRQSHIVSASSSALTASLAWTLSRESDSVNSRPSSLPLIRSLSPSAVPLRRVSSMGKGQCRSRPPSPSDSINNCGSTNLLRLSLSPKSRSCDIVELQSKALLSVSASIYPEEKSADASEVTIEKKLVITSPSSASLQRIKTLEERNGIKIRRSSPSDLVGLLDKDGRLLKKVLSPSSELKETEQTSSNRNALRRMHAMMTASQLIGPVRNTIPSNEGKANLRSRSLESLKALKSVAVVRDDPALVISPPQQEIASAESSPGLLLDPVSASVNRNALRRMNSMMSSSTLLAPTERISKEESNQQIIATSRSRSLEALLTLRSVAIEQDNC